MFYLVSLVTNQQDQHQSLIEEFTDLEKAIVRYHNSLAAFHNAEDVKHAIVEILNDDGLLLTSYKESVSHYIPEEEPVEQEEESKGDINA